MQQGTSIVVALLAGALGGVAGNFAASSLRARPPEAKPATADYGDDLRELSAKVSALDAQVTRLAQQQRLSNLRPVQPAAATGDAPARAPNEDPAFETAVRDVMDKMQQERQKERDQRREQAAQRWADTLSDKLELTDKQKASVLGVAEDVLEKMREMREAEPGPGPGPSFREQRTNLIAQGEQRLSEVLSGHQMDIYKQSPDLHIDQVMRGGWGPGRGGP